MKGKWRIFLAALLVVSVFSGGCSRLLAEPDAEQIKADLIGKDMPGLGGWPLPVWRFAALSEFQELNIKSKQKQGQIIEYDVSMRLQDLESKNRYLADAVIVYKKANGKWELISIVPKLWKEIGKGLYRRINPAV